MNFCITKDEDKDDMHLYVFDDESGRKVSDFVLEREVAEKLYNSLKTVLEL